MSRGVGMLASSVPPGSEAPIVSATPTPTKDHVQQRVREALATANIEMRDAPPLSKAQVHELRVLWRAYQLQNNLPPVSGETLLEVYVLLQLREAVSAVNLKAPPKESR